MQTANHTTQHAATHNTCRGAMQAKLIYDAIAESGGFYSSPVDPAVRSCMNVPFTIPSSSDLEAEFIKEASAANLVRPSPYPPCPSLRTSFCTSTVFVPQSLRLETVLCV